MVDHEHKCIYFHQRKAAGSSIITAFGKSSSDRDWHRFNGGAMGSEWQGVSHPESLYFVFSSVRNPFDRIVSAWKYLPLLRDKPLEYVLANLPATGHDYRHISMPQVDLLLDQATGKLATHDIIRFESLQPDFDRICRRIGKPTVSLPHINHTRRVSDYRSYYTATSKRLVEMIFRKDLDAFSYTF